MMESSSKLTQIMGIARLLLGTATLGLGVAMVKSAYQTLPQPTQPISNDIIEAPGLHWPIYSMKLIMGVFVNVCGCIFLISGATFLLLYWRPSFRFPKIFYVFMIFLDFVIGPMVCFATSKMALPPSEKVSPAANLDSIVYLVLFLVYTLGLCLIGLLHLRQRRRRSTSDATVSGETSMACFPSFLCRSSSDQQLLENDHLDPEHHERQPYPLLLPSYEEACRNSPTATTTTTTTSSASLPYPRREDSPPPDYDFQPKPTDARENSPPEYSV